MASRALRAVHWARGRAGLGRPGRGRTGRGRAEQGKAGQGGTGQGRAGQGRAGQGRAGQGRPGQGRAWEVAPCKLQTLLCQDSCIAIDAVQLHQAALVLANA